MTRRSFCFLFGAGVAGALVAPSLYKFTGMTPFGGETVPRVIHAGLDLAPGTDVTVVSKRIYGSSGWGPHIHIATVPPEASHMVVDGGLRFTDGAGRPVEPSWVAPAYRKGIIAKR
jgi:hypothetical protein